MTKTKMNLKIEHQVPGRVRMKIPAGKGNPDLLKQVSETFAVIPGIEHVTVNPTTGSVVLFYDVDRHDEFHGTFRGHYQEHGGSNGSALEEIRKRLGLSFALVQDSQQRIARQYGVRCWPTTIAIAANGRAENIQFGMAHEHRGAAGQAEARPA